MMDIELAYIIVAPLDAALWMLGGKYNKALRRYGVPAVHLTALVLAGAAVVAALIHAVLLVAALSLGYGEASSWWRRCLVALAYFYAFGILGFNAWVVIMPLAFLLMFYLSNSKIGWVAKAFTWKACEGLLGVFQGIVLCQMLH